MGIRNFYAQRDAASQQTDLRSSLHDSKQSLERTNEQLSLTSLTLQQSRFAEEYMKGQLSGLSMMVGKLGSNQDSGNVALAAALRDISKSSSAALNGPPGLKGLSNAELRNQAMQMVALIRSIEEQFQSESDQIMMVPMGSRKSPAEADAAWQAGIQAHEEAHQREVNRWHPLHVQCGLLITEMLSRIPQSAIPKENHGIVQMTIEDDFLAGANPLGEIADYMEKLALTLPQQKSRLR